MFDMFLGLDICSVICCLPPTEEGMPLGVDKKAGALLLHVHWQACGSRSGGTGSVARPLGTSPAAGSESPERISNIFVQACHDSNGASSPLRLKS